MKVLRFVILCLCWCNVYQVFGQVAENAIPFSAQENLPAITFFNKIPSVDSALYNEHKSTQQSTTHFQFAWPIDTSLDPYNSGEWCNTLKGRVWRIGIQSFNAHSLYISMQYLLQPGVRLFVYGPGYNNIQGAFTSHHNNSTNRLSTLPVQGDVLILELNLPPSQNNFGELKIRKVYHDYLGFYDKQSSDKQSLRQKSCEENINCSNGQFWQTEKRAVCKIISSGKIGTGTLIGNTSYNSTPYVLTAQHLISSSEDAAEALFIFNYETTACNEELPTIIQSLSGASLLATTEHHVDFALLKLHEKPPASYQPYYAGWDVRNNLPQGGVCIHHPYGNLKQIAIDYHPLVNESVGQGYDENSTLKVSQWEIGFTEPGSSGAPLFNNEHRVIGTLTGGRSTCAYPRDDYFSKLGVAWDTFPDPSLQLKYWLDSAQTGQVVLDGYDPYGFNNMYCDTAWNVKKYETFELSNKGLAWGWISGHNARGYTQFAERFEPAAVLQINGIYLHVAKAVSSNPLANIQLKIWDGDQFPETECYSRLVFLKDLKQDKINYIGLDTVLKKSKTFFVGYEINYNAISDTFAIYHAENRGDSGPSSMYIYNSSWFESSNSEALGIATSLGLGISECYGKSKEPKPDQISVYPNPCKNSVSLSLPKDSPISEVWCFDSSGHFVPIDWGQNESGNILSFELPPGVYHLRIMAGGRYFTSRFLVL